MSGNFGFGLSCSLLLRSRSSTLTDANSNPTQFKYDVRLRAGSISGSSPHSKARMKCRKILTPEEKRSKLSSR